jgi:hypothetical protein
VAFGSREKAFPNRDEQEWALRQLPGRAQVLLEDVGDVHTSVRGDAGKADDHSLVARPPYSR